MGEKDEGHFVERRKSSYKKKVMGIGSDAAMEGDGQDRESDASDDDDDDFEDDVEGPWISMGMTKDEKNEVRKPWRLSLIIKLIGRSIEYQFLLCRLQALWKPQHGFMLIDLSNEFFIARFANQQDYEVALLANGSINDYYLHVPRWIPNFMSHTMSIDSLLEWV